MNDVNEVKIWIIKELFKLPCDENTHAVKSKDITNLIEKIVNTIPADVQKQYLERQ